tara:strand:- start:947 stop:1534 length:588 start_codon:yes stop_codon:yes gene_type:complete
MKLTFIEYILIVIVVGASFYIYHQSEFSSLKCIISDVDGKKYCVRDRRKLELAADRLANANKHMKEVVEHCKKKYPKMDNVSRLVSGYNPKKIYETLPTSKFTAYSQNKGEKLAFCLDTEKNDGDLIDMNTLTFVALHELSHVATKSVGHTEEFWENFKFLLKEASEIGVYDPIDYSKSPKRYCGMTITDNPYYG